MLLRPVGDETPVGWAFYCPACDMRHVFWTAGKVTWTFDGNHEAPTFHPSLRNRWEEGEAKVEKVCHLTISKGVISYCADCTHSFAGRQIPMVPADSEDRQKEP